VSGFSAAWLALRSAADDRARSAALEQRLAGWLRARLASAPGGPLTCVDLACGAGANLRRLAPRLPGPQRWRAVDADEALLAHVGPACVALRDADGGATTVELRQRDLASAPLAAELGGAALVTGSALLDLVSGPWLDALADAARDAGAAGLFALDYDGRRECSPADPCDARAHAAFERHQRTAKGFGPALGGDAVVGAARAFAARGYAVHRARSDWVLGPSDAALQRELLRGWADAAIAIEPGARDELLAWLQRRLAHVASGASRLRVGHEDLLALPA
jgi:hypothetical protein